MFTETVLAGETFTIKRTMIPGVTAVEAKSDRVFPPHTHEEFGFGVIRAGAQTSLSGRGVVEAGEGALITVNPNEVHDGAPIGDLGRAWQMLYVDPALIASTASDIRQTHGVWEFHHPVLADGRATDLFLRLYCLATANDNSSRLATDSLFLALVDRLITDSPIEKVPARPSAALRAITRIDDDPADEVTLADLARVSGLSQYQVLRAIRAITGLTPHAYQMQKRTDLARRLIRRGTHLAEAAAASGFYDQSHMTRVFVARYGITPGAYAAATA